MGIKDAFKPRDMKQVVRDLNIIGKRDPVKALTLAIDVNSPRLVNYVMNGYGRFFTTYTIEDAIFGILRKGRYIPSPRNAGYVVWKEESDEYIEVTRMLVESLLEQVGFEQVGFEDYLFNASKHGSIKSVKLFLDKGANPNSGMNIACQHDHLDVIHLLLERGANVKQIEISDRSLYWCALNQNDEAIELLIANGADLRHAIETMMDKDVASYLHKFLDKGHRVDESIGDLLKPKSQKEIDVIMDSLSLREYEDLITQLKSRHDLSEIIFYLEELTKDEFIERAYADKIPPHEYFEDVLLLHFSEAWEPDGVKQITQDGGIELQLTGDGQGVYYRYTWEIIPRSADVEYGYNDIFSGETDETTPYFVDDMGHKQYLDEFMRV